MPARLTLADYRRTVEAINNAGGDRGRAAKALSIGVVALQRRLQKMPPELRDELTVPWRGGKQWGRRDVGKPPGKKTSKDAPLSRLEWQLWRQWRAKDCLAARERLAELYVPLADGLCRNMLLSLPGHADRQSVSSAAYEGLRQALESFDPKRRVKFSTYATARIRGSMLDELRRLARNSRAVHGWMQRRDKAIERLTVRGDAVNEETITAEMEEKPRRPIVISSLEKAILKETNGGRVRRRLGEWLIGEPARRESPAELTAHLAALLRGLSFEEQVVIYCYYWRDATMKAIAAALDLSESRISQLHSELMAKLQARGRETLIDEAA